MPDETPLSDDEIYELLHSAWLMFNGRTVETPLGQDVITVMIRNIELTQQAMIAVREGISLDPQPKPE